MPGSTFIHTGMTPLRLRATAVNTVPRTITVMRDCITALLAFSYSCLPLAWEMYARNPTPNAETVLISSQLTVDVDPTAAVASVPRLPTIAVSMYWTAVASISSSIVGHARVKISGRYERSKYPLRDVPDILFLLSCFSYFVFSQEL